MKYLLQFIIASALITLLSGCEKRPFYEYDDEPYLVSIADKPGVQKKMLASIYRDDRELALRAMARQIRVDLAQGQEAYARENLRLLLQHYAQEGDWRVRSVIVGVCLREANYPDPKVWDFLRGCLGRGECLADACQTLAARKAPQAFGCIRPFLQHPRPEVQYEAALALLLLDDPRVIPVLQEYLAAKQLAGKQGYVYEMSWQQAQANLQARTLALAEKLAVEETEE